MVQTVEALTDSAAAPALDDTARMPDVRTQRDQAHALLQSLLDAKAECETHQARFNRPDMFRAVTGRSALDATIASTRRIVERLDALLARAEATVEVKVASMQSAERARRGGRLA